jgi:2-phosphoglycolate phosphatase
MPLTRAVLFDLDGTLLDTAQDLAFALNQVRHLHQLPELPFDLLRPVVGQGTRALLTLSFGPLTEARLMQLREQFFMFYQQHFADSSCLFPDMEKVLSHLEEKKIPWGIVTNKPERFTRELLKKLHLTDRAACVISGDTLPRAKPDPEPIRYACQLIQKNPLECVYVGDMATDVIASKAAGMPALVALYGYLDAKEDPYSWGADAYIKHPLEIIDWLTRAC